MRVAAIILVALVFPPSFAGDRDSRMLSLLAESHQLWELRNVDTYRYTIVRGGAFGERTYKVRVEDSKCTARSRNRRDESKARWRETTCEGLTLPELFADVRDQLLDGTRAAELRVDEKFGFVRSFSAHPDTEFTDQAWYFQVKRFRASRSARGEGPMSERKVAPEARVAVLIEAALAAVSQSEQEAAFHAIENLGCRAAPGIVAHLDDRRRLPFRYLSLVNGPGHFEAFRQYGPVVVTDALAAILNQLTGESFGFIYNGGTEQERQATVEGWRALLENRPIAALCGEGSGLTASATIDFRTGGNGESRWH